MDSHPPAREKNEARYHRDAGVGDSRPSRTRKEVVHVTEVSPEEAVRLSCLNIRPSTETPDDRPQSQKGSRKESHVSRRWATEEMSFDHVSFTDNRGVTVGKEQLRYAKNGEEQMRAIRELGKPDSARLFINPRSQFALPSRTGTPNPREVGPSTDDHSQRPGSRSEEVSHATTPHLPHCKKKERNGNVDPRAESPSRGPNGSGDRHRDRKGDASID